MKIPFHGGVLLFWMLAGFISLGLLLFLNFQLKSKSLANNKVPEENSTDGLAAYPSNFKTDQKDDNDFTASLLLTGLDQAGTPEEFADGVINNINREFQIVQALFYLKENGGNKQEFKLITGYAISETSNNEKFTIGEGINGQAAADGQVIILSDIPDKYRIIESGLGSGKPPYIGIVPLMYEKECLALLEFSAFKKRTMDKKDILQIFSLRVGQVLFNIIQNR